jgi:hypothetical protein
MLAVRASHDKEHIMPASICRFHSKLTEAANIASIASQHGHSEDQPTFPAYTGSFTSIASQYNKYSHHRMSPYPPAYPAIRAIKDSQHKRQLRPPA